MSATKPLSAIFPSDSADFGHCTPRSDPGDDLVETVIQAKPGGIAVNFDSLRSPSMEAIDTRERIIVKFL